MLVLNRRVNEEIVLMVEDKTIVIAPLKIRNTGKNTKSVSLGIDAPPDVEVWRRELLNDTEA